MNITIAICFGIQCCTQGFSAHSGVQRAVHATLNAPECWDALANAFLSPLQGHSAISLCSLGRMAAPWLVVPLPLTSSHVRGPSPSLLSSFSFSCSFSLYIFVFQHWLLGPAPGILCSAEELSRHVSSLSVFIFEVLIDYFNHNLLFSYNQTPDTSTLFWKQSSGNYKEGFSGSPGHVRYASQCCIA